MIIAFISFLNTMLSYFDIIVTALSYIAGISFLTLLFLYISSYVFKFCAWHRVFLHYIVVNNILNWYDYEYGVPVSLRSIICIQLCIAISFIFIGLYLYKHDKLPRKEDCGETHKRVR